MPELVDDRRATGWWLGPHGEPGPVLRECLAATIAAPSVHNTQPWRFHAHHAVVDVYADRSRQLPVVDPDGRELLLSLGAAVFNLKVAIRVHGRLPAQLLQPDPRAPDLVVRIGPGPPSVVPHTARALAWAIPLRRSNRWPFAPVAPPPDVLSGLTAAANAEGATLRVLSGRGRRNLLRLIRVAEDQWCGDPAYRAELVAWTRETPERRDGVPPAAAGPHVAAGGVPLRDFGLAQPIPRRKEISFEPSPTIAVLYADDTPQQWLRAGQSLQRALLTAHVYGLGTTLLTQPLENPRLRELTAHAATGQAAQAIIRLGYVRRPASSSPRRSLAEVLQ